MLQFNFNEWILRVDEREIVLFMPVISKLRDIIYCRSYDLFQESISTREIVLKKDKNIERFAFISFLLFFGKKSISSFSFNVYRINLS